MTGDELAAALRGKGWEMVTVETFAEWLGDNPMLLEANVGHPDYTLRVKVGKGPAQAMCAVTTWMLEHGDGQGMVGYIHNKLRHAWADAVWEAS